MRKAKWQQTIKKIKIKQEEEKSQITTKEIEQQSNNNQATTQKELGNELNKNTAREIE
jgi:hypothetical protein